MATSCAGVHEVGIEKAFACFEVRVVNVSMLNAAVAGLASPIRTRASPPQAGLSYISSPQLLQSLP
jgi:hypothetical protein